jgi:hypothetical protein
MRTAGGLALVLALGAVSLPFAQAQTANKGGGDSAPAGVGFSIESEMLTYRALETNSEAIACDVAAFLNGTTAKFTNPPPGAVCDVGAAGSRIVTIVLLPFDKSAFADFQMWRDDIAKMERLEHRADSFGCSTDGQSKGAVTTAANSALMLTPAGPMLNAAQGVLGLLASEEATSPVTGTIQDQAFMNGVGRQLRALKVPVIMPTGYSPHSLEALDYETSPFLANLGRILKAEGCLKGLKANGGSDDQTRKDAISDVISEIEKFRSMFDDVVGSETNSTKTPAESTDKTAGTLPATSSTVSPAASSNHLLAVLFADGLAQKLLDQDAGKVYVLLLKALESGGSVTRYTNVLGTKVHYSGGFVGTYALFTTGGTLECSGNVSDYEGPVKAKHFQRDMDKTFNPDPSKQMIFPHGCLTSR